MGCGDEKLSKYLTQTFTAHCNAMICQQVTLSGDAEWPKVADAVIEAYHPTLSGLDSHTMMLSYSLLLVDRQALSEHTTTSSSTESLGQALRVSLVKPGAYLSES
jgi:hypothetical protein